MLNEKNFLEFASKSYSNPNCFSVDEFLEDLARIKYVKRLLNRYVSGGNLQERLIVNHIICIYNVFDIACANQMLFYKLLLQQVRPKDSLPYKQFLSSQMH